METRQIAEAFARYQAAEHAYYNEALFPFFEDGITLSPEWREQVTVLRSTVMQTRADYFAALRITAA
jgi:hypothetical protein